MALCASKEGQATVEFLLVLLFLMVLAWQFFKYIGLFVGNHIGGFGYHLTDFLATGVCENHCVFHGFQNGL